MSNRRCNYLITGGGILGLSLARELISRGASNILILEKEPETGLHASGRNSGILHAGVYYEPSSLKARFCLKGNLLLQEYCREHNLSLLDSRKVILTKNQSEIPVLEELHRRAKENGARVELIDESQLKDVEPFARTADKALLSWNTATIAPLEILQHIQSELLASGRVKILTGHKFLELGAGNSARVLTGKNIETIQFEHFINAGGVFADRVAACFGAGDKYTLIPFRGNYKKLSPKESHKVRGNLYPVPDIRNPFLGVHFSRNIKGEVYIGPTATPVFGPEIYKGYFPWNREAFRILAQDAVLFLRNSKFRSNGLSEIRKYFPRNFYNDAAAMLAGLKPEHIQPAVKTGIRPQLVNWKTKEMVMDFVVEKAENSTHILNAISPAFTSSLPFAEFVVSEYIPH